jgi:predicted nucleotidyltransferase
MPDFCWHAWKTQVTDAQHGMHEAEYALVHHILATWLPGGEVRMFGSRALGTHKPYSDLDLVIMGNTPTDLSTLGQLKEAFASSDLPWRVDVVDWATTTPEFRSHIATDSSPLPPAQPL